MRGWIVGMLWIAGCDDEDGAVAAQCAELAEEQPACMPDAAIAECEATAAACDGGLVVLESCPLQFGCSE